MFIFTTKLNRKRLVLIILALALLLCAVILMSPTRLLKTGGQSDLAMEQAMSKKVASEEERVAFLKDFGWELEEEPVEISEVEIPKEFDEVYNAYNSIQKEQGYDLLKYRGKTAMLYTYKILNYPSEEKEVRANVLVYDDKVIGGDVCSLNLDGFMHGFEMPEDKSTETPEAVQLEEQQDTAAEVQNQTQGEEPAVQGNKPVDGLFGEE